MKHRNADLIDTAAGWHERLEEDSRPRTRAEFEAWLAADPRHAAAFSSVDRAWTRIATAAADPRIAGLRREALSAGGRRRAYPLLAAVAACAAVAVGFIFMHPDKTPGGGNEFVTAAGQQSRIALPDGSSLTLNTRSRLEVAFDPTQRRVRLLQGQAWFEVASDVRRPFVVEAGTQRITALGTAFDVRLRQEPRSGSSTVVTLVEGRVAVEPIPAPASRLSGKQPPPRSELAPGEELIVSAGAPVLRRKADVTRIASWREGQIVFDNDTLAAAVAEVNRYCVRQIVLAPELADLRVSGVFKAGHILSFVETVSGHYPIRVAQQSADRIVLARR